MLVASAGLEFMVLWSPLLKSWDSDFAPPEALRMATNANSRKGEKRHSGKKSK